MAHLRSMSSFKHEGKVLKEGTAEFKVTNPSFSAP